MGNICLTSLTIFWISPRVGEIQRIFEIAVEDGILPRNPASGIKITIPDPKQMVLNAKEVNELLYNARETHHRFYPVWVFALMTGMRSGEMMALRWSDVDFETGLISVTKQWTSKDGLHETKANRNRVVPINPELEAFLKELKIAGSHKDAVFAGGLLRRGSERNHGLPMKTICYQESWNGKMASKHRCSKIFVVHLG